MQIPGLANYLPFHLTMMDVKMFTNNPYTERSSVEIGLYPNENCEIRSCCFAYKKVLAAIWKANC